MANVTLNSGDWGGQVLDGSTVLVPETLNVDVDTDLDTNGDIQALIDISPGYRHSFGTSAAPVLSNATLIKMFGAGEFHFVSKDNGASAEDTAEVILQCANNGVKCSLDTDAAVHVDGGNFGIIRCLRGNIVLKSGIDFTGTTGAVNVAFVENQASDVNLFIAGTSNTLPILNITGGKTLCNATVTRAVVATGQLTQDLRATVTLDILAGGIVQYDWTALGIINVYSGGFLDLTVKSVFRASGTINIYAGGRVKYDPSLTAALTINDYSRAA